MPSIRTSLRTDAFATSLEPRLVKDEIEPVREAGRGDETTKAATLRLTPSDSGDSSDGPTDGSAASADIQPIDIATLETELAPLLTAEPMQPFSPPPDGLQAMSGDMLVAGYWGSGSGGLLPLSGTFTGTTGNDAVHGGEGNDTVLDHADGLYWVYDHDSLYGHGGNDLIIAGLGDDLLEGGDGSDSLYGGFGDDSLLGGEGVDSLFGGDGNDTLDAGGGAYSIMYGEDGNDVIIGGVGDDWARGGSHDDYIEGGAGNDSLWGDDVDTAAPVHGDDIILGGDGDDEIWGLGGDDVIYGGDGHDRIEGWSGDDLLQGGLGNDVLIGETLGSQQDGNDVLDGGAGDDILLDFSGSNVMTGGSGEDYFLATYFSDDGSPQPVPDTFSHNTATDYDAAEGDKVQGYSAAQVGTATHVYSDTDQLLFILLDHDLQTDGINLIW